MTNGDTEVVVGPEGCRIIIDDASTSDIHGTNLDSQGWVHLIVGITGYAEECSKVAVYVEGNSVAPIEVDVDPITRTWEVPSIVIKPPMDLCGNAVTLKAYCVEDEDCKTEKTIFNFPCQSGLCPTITGTVNPDGDCANGERQVEFTLHFDPPVPAGAQVDIFWVFAPGTDSQSIEPTDPLSVLTRTEGYPAGDFYPAAEVEVTVGDEQCPPVAVEFYTEAEPMVVQPGCGDPVDCPEASILDFSVQGCAPRDPYAEISALLDPQPPDTPPSDYVWTIVTPGNEEFVRVTTDPSVDTRDAWANAMTGTLAPLNLNVPGPYSVRLEATIANTLVGCEPEATRTFTVEQCPECPVIILDDPHPNITGCTPGSAKAVFTAQVQPPGTVVTAYHWEIGFVGTAPPAKRTTTEPTANSEDQWEVDGGPGTSSLENHLTTVNNVTVTAEVQNLPDTCPVPTDTRQFVVPQCQTNGNGGNGDPPQINWCMIWMIVMLIVMALSAVLLGVGICLATWPGINTVSVWIGGIMAGIGAVLLVLCLISFVAWLLICGVRVPANCWLVDILIDALLFLTGISGLIALAAAIFASLLGNYFCWIGWTIDAAYFGVLFTISYWFARAVGCRPWPRWVPDWARISLPEWMIQRTDG